MGSVVPRNERRFTPVEVPPLHPGDLLVVRTPRLAYGAGRWLGGSRHDHVGVLLPGDRVLNIVKPRAVVSPLARMLVAERTPCILRPAFRSDAARAPTS